MLLATGARLAVAQASPTASRAGDLQFGVGYTLANSDYAYISNRIRGVAFSSDFDTAFKHLGAEVNFHQLNDPNGTAYERTFEGGVRYVRRYGRFRSYAKALYGRGILNFPYDEGNVGYNLFAAGAGVEVEVRPSLGVRADFERQQWLAAPGILHGLTPSLLTISIIYHVGAGPARPGRQ